jgi:glycerate-2-kinase
MRILNQDALVSHGHVRGRKAIVEILEAGLEAADPYNATRKLMRVVDGRLIVGCPDFEPDGDPRSGDEIIDLATTGRIFVFGAGKGVMRVAKAIEDVLGDRLSGGHVIAKHGDADTLRHIGVTFGAHPVPDEGCVRGCDRILEMSRGLTDKDLVFTIACNGISSLLTKPMPGVTLDDIRRVTYIMQIERGAPTGDLNPIRNHIDMMKGGKFSMYLQPARAIHIFAAPSLPYDRLMHENLWLHNLPEGSTFQDARAMLKKWDAYDAVPASVHRLLEQANPQDETIKADQFEKTRFRVFGIMPVHLSMIPTAKRTAEKLGFKALTLAEDVRVEAREAGRMTAFIARTIEKTGQPVEPPLALFSSGEMVVTVGKETGMGGRNQEYCVAAASAIAGSKNVVMASVDSDGTDGPGCQFCEQELDGVTCLAGGIVDGDTAREANQQGVDLVEAQKRHNTSPALHKLDSGVVATPNISINDLTVTLIMARDSA